MLDAPHVLFLTWQGESCSTHFPVGQLADLETSPRYEFTYLHGALEAGTHGFRPFAGMPSLTQAYRSDTLHPVFQNRLMPSSRPDFNRYVHQIGLTQDSRPIEILGRGAGPSQTDRIELFSAPGFDARSRTWVYHFPVRGLRFLPDSVERRIGALAPGERLYCMPDLQNEADPDAVALRTGDRVLIGYVPRYMSKDVSSLLSGDVNVEVSRINPHPVPIQLRLFCRLIATAPASGFKPFSSEDYRPLAPGATRIEWLSERRAG